MKHSNLSGSWMIAHASSTRRHDSGMADRRAWKPRQLPAHTRARGLRVRAEGGVHSEVMDAGLSIGVTAIGLVMAGLAFFGV